MVKTREVEIFETDVRRFHLGSGPALPEEEEHNEEDEEEDEEEEEEREGVTVLRV